MSEQSVKLLRLMRLWLVVTFIIVWAAVTMYIGLFSIPDWWMAIRAGFPIWGVTGLLCIIWYVVYYLVLRRRQG